MSAAETLLHMWQHQQAVAEEAVQHAKEQVEFYAGRVALELANKLNGEVIDG